MQGLLGRDPVNPSRGLLMRQGKRIGILMPPGLDGGGELRMGVLRRHSRRLGRLRRLLKR